MVMVELMSVCLPAAG